MKPVREVVSRDIIDDLWGAGYTILPRNRHPDPFYVPSKMVPATRSYQWMHLIHDKALFLSSDGRYCLGWSPVPAPRHDGYFMPAGHIGDIEVSGLGLFEKPKFEVDAERAQHVAAAHKQVEWGGEFSGDVTVGGERTEIGATKTVENITAIPKEMVPYIAQIFEERDYLGKLYAEDLANDTPVWSTLLIAEIATKMDAAMKSDHGAPKWPILNAIILPFAIANIRKRINKEAASAKAS